MFFDHLEAAEHVNVTHIISVKDVQLAEKWGRAKNCSSTIDHMRLQKRVSPHKTPN